MSLTSNIVVTLKIPFPTKQKAQIAYDVLRIDSEPKRSCIEKSIILQENILLLELTGEQAKNVRVAVSSFFDMLLLCCETLHQYGPPVSDIYDHY